MAQHFPDHLEAFTRNTRLCIDFQYSFKGKSNKNDFFEYKIKSIWTQRKVLHIILTHMNQVDNNMKYFHLKTLPNLSKASGNLQERYNFIIIKTDKSGYFLIQDIENLIKEVSKQLDYKKSFKRPFQGLVDHHRNLFNITIKDFQNSNTSIEKVVGHNQSY